MPVSPASTENENTAAVAAAAAAATDATERRRKGLDSCVGGRVRAWGDGEGDMRQKRGEMKKRQAWREGIDNFFLARQNMPMDFGVAETKGKRDEKNGRMMTKKMKTKERYARTPTHVLTKHIHTFFGKEASRSVLLIAF